MSSRMVLAADDDPAILRYYSRLLGGGARHELDILGASDQSDISYDFRPFGDPLALLEFYTQLRARQESAPLAIVDMRMPAMNGLEVAKCLRGLDPNLNIIICSAYSDANLQTIISALDSSVYVLHKPFNINEFRLLVRSIVSGWQHLLHLERNRAELECVIEATRAAIWRWDLERGAVEVDRRWTEIVGYTSQQVLAGGVEFFWSTIHPDDVSMVRHQLERHFSCLDSYYDCEFRVRHMDGTWLWVHDSGKVMEWVASGKPRQMLGTRVDISARKQTECELRETNANLELAVTRADEMARKAELASRAKSQFLATMSHEIRTPMNGVLGMLGVLLETELSSEQRLYAHNAQLSGEVLLSLISDILDFSRIEAGKFLLKSEEFAPVQLLQDTFTVLDRSAKEKELLLHKTLAPEVPPLLKGDFARLRQVLLNLAGNAVKFTQQGEVSVHVECVFLTATQCMLRFSVHDTGIGIASNDQQQLFEPFSQADNSNTRRYGGAGLGLSIAKQICELMGGAIGLTSELGKGSTFWFTALLERVERTQVDPMKRLASPMPFAATTLPLLLVEDNAANRLLAVRVLEKLGYVVKTASNGVEALNALQRDRFALVLMDCQMPEMDGFDATRSIRSGDANVLDATVPIIAMTANALVEDRDRCLAAGMTDYITKPVVPKVLAQVIARHLRAIDDSP